MAIIDACRPARGGGRRSGRWPGWA